MCCIALYCITYYSTIELYFLAFLSAVCGVFIQPLKYKMQKRAIPCFLHKHGNMVTQNYLHKMIQHYEHYSFSHHPEATHAAAGWGNLRRNPTPSGETTSEHYFCLRWVGVGFTLVFPLGPNVDSTYGASGTFNVGRLRGTALGQIIGPALFVPLGNE